MQPLTVITALFRNIADPANSPAVPASPPKTGSLELQNAFRDLFWNPSMLDALPSLLLSLVAAALLGTLLGAAYVRLGHSLSNRRVFARNFLLLTVTTTLIITIVKSSLALSLGLVGALSIVRFRAAIKEPEELAFLFLAIAVGLGLGAGQGLLTIAACVLILGLLAIRNLVRRTPESPNLFLTVTSTLPEKLTAGQIIEAMAASGAKADLKRFDESPEAMEASFQTQCMQVKNLEDFIARLRKISRTVRISCLDDRGVGA